MLLENCDHDFNGNVDECELFACVNKGENEWRDANCEPCFGHVTCDAPPKCGCEHAMWCDDIINLSEEIMSYYDTNNDNGFNPLDNLDGEHAKFLYDTCDYNKDGTVDSCELFECLIELENKYRVEFCGEDFGDLYCIPPSDCDCPEAWTCEDVIAEVDAAFSEYNTNGDAKLDLGDDMSAEIMEIYATCDANMDGAITKCEMFDCVLEW